MLKDFSSKIDGHIWSQQHSQTHHKQILPFTLVVTIVAIGFSFKNQLNDVPTGYFDKSTEFRQATDFQQQHLSGMTSIDFSIFTNQDSGVNDPQTLQVIEKFSQWLQKFPLVKYVLREACMPEIWSLQEDNYLKYV